MNDKIFHVCVANEKLSVVMLLWVCHEPQKDLVIRKAKRDGCAIIVTRDAIFASSIVNDVPTAQVKIEICSEKIIKI